MWLHAPLPQGADGQLRHVRQDVSSQQLSMPCHQRLHSDGLAATRRFATINSQVRSTGVVGHPGGADQMKMHVPAAKTTTCPMKFTIMRLR